MTEYIDRETVLNILASKNAPWDGYQKVSELPTADVQLVKHGWWVFNKLPNNWEEMRLSTKIFYVCDICGHIADDISNYCPDCGAKMDGKN